MIDLSKEELDRLYKGSKYDCFIVVGSEVRQLVGMVRRSVDRIEALETQLADNSERYGNEIASRIGAMEEDAQHWHELFMAAAARIEALEAALRDEKMQDIESNKIISDQADRIEALEAALRRITDLYDGHYGVAMHIARAALAPEQDI